MTEKERARAMQDPRIRRFVESGDERLATKLVSMAYLLTSTANTCQDEANEILAKYGVAAHNVKWAMSGLMKAYDQYTRVLKSMVPDMEAKLEVVQDVQMLQDFVQMLLKGKVDVKRGKYYTAALYLPEDAEFVNSNKDIAQ